MFKFTTVVTSIACLTVAITLAGVGFSQEPQRDPGSPAPAADKAKDQPQREQILKSGRWREAVFELNQWLSVQQIYKEQEVEQLKAKWKAEIDAMSADELSQTLLEVERKLTILLSPDAKEARLWFASFRARQAMYTEEELREKLPNVIDMTAAQLQLWLDEFKAWRGKRQATQQSADQFRQKQVAAAQNFRQRQAAAAKRSANQAASFRGANVAPAQPRARSHYAPARFRPAYPIARYRGWRWW